MVTHPQGTVASVQTALAGMARPFALGGVLPRNDVHLQLRVGKGQTMDVGPMSGVDLPTILQHCTIAPFGMGACDVVDTTVRCAWETAQLDPVIPESLATQLQESLDTLAPPGKTLRAKLYKLHVYTEGGFFLEHADTLHGPNHMATLIVCLPVAHEGGELIVRNGGQSHVFGFAGPIS